MGRMLASNHAYFQAVKVSACASLWGRIGVGSRRGIEPEPDGDDLGRHLSRDLDRQW